MKKQIILDCDPGHDDAVAIMLAAASSEIEILGITCVGGNVGLNNTTNKYINSAPNKLLLKKFGGNLTITEYRKLFITVLILSCFFLLSITENVAPLVFNNNAGGVF